MRERLPFCTYVAEPCDCPAAVADREQVLELERAAEKDRQLEIIRQASEKRMALIRKYSLGMPDKLRACSFDNFQALPFTVEALRAAQRLVARDGQGKGLILRGDVGTGKTHLAAAIANAEIAAGRSALCGTVSDLLSRIRATFDSDTESEAQVISALQNCSLLVLDDFGKEAVTAWVEEKVYSVLNYRYARGLRVVVTMNLSLEFLQQRYPFNGKAIVSRLYEMCDGVVVKGPDFRKAR